MSFTQPTNVSLFDLRKLKQEAERADKSVRDRVTAIESYLHDLYDWAVVAAAAIPTAAPPEPPF